MFCQNDGQLLFRCAKLNAQKPVDLKRLFTAILPKKSKTRLKFRTYVFKSTTYVKAQKCTRAQDTHLSGANQILTKSRLEFFCKAQLRGNQQFFMVKKPVFRDKSIFHFDCIVPGVVYHKEKLTTTKFYR